MPQGGPQSTRQQDLLLKECEGIFWESVKTSCTFLVPVGHSGVLTLPRTHQTVCVHNGSIFHHHSCKLQPHPVDSNGKEKKKVVAQVFPCILEGQTAHLWLGTAPWALPRGQSPVLLKSLPSPPPTIGTTETHPSPLSPCWPAARGVCHPPCVILRVLYALVVLWSASSEGVGCVSSCSQSVLPRFLTSVEVSVTTQSCGVRNSAPGVGLPQAGPLCCTFAVVFRGFGKPFVSEWLVWAVGGG